MAKGFLQQPGSNYFETFSSTARPAIYRLLFALAARYGWHIHQWDVVATFLRAAADHQIYIQQPTGFEDGSNRIYLLLRSIYGLKQSARLWHDYLTGKLAKYGLVLLDSDDSVFRSLIGRLFLVIHIDDILVFAASLDDISVLRQNLKSEFELTDLGEARYFLGIEIVRNRNERSLMLTQRGYTVQLLSRFAPNVKPARIPVQLGTKMDISTSPLPP